jgi:predicted CXXCH cytochrome family protein
MGKRRYAIHAALLFLALFALIAGPADAENAGPSAETQACLSCHTKHGLVVTFENNEFIEAYLDAEKFNISAHNSLSCSACHPDFSAGNHPRRTFRSKSHYQTKAALVCRRCHTDRQIRSSSIHATLLNEEKSGTATICTNCHGSHAVARITKKGVYADEESYCMKCHGYSVKMSFRNGETLSGTINLSSLEASVHNKASCSDCHYGFSSEEHPQRNFASRRDYTLAASENCRRCHFDKYTRTMESIHYTLLSQGNLNAPVCVDCHGSHGISHISRERALIARRCQRCHAGIYEIYAKSVHGSALFNEHNQDVPVCADCHTAHTIKDPHTLDYRERVPEMCSNCHANEAVVGKYGLSVSVVDSYLSDFHGVTLKFYRLQKDALNKPARPMAVCTDCHGIHNINSTVGPNATVVKANLVKRCQKCHANASTNFPDSWISHYKPSPSRAPLVFFIMMAYKIFIPVLIAGLVLQILLHIWRYVVDR